MKSGLAFGLGMLLGAGGAAVVAHTVLKQHYAQKADEEITACREAFLEESKRRWQDQNDKKQEEVKNAAVEAMKTYSQEPETVEKQIEKVFEPSKKETSKDWKKPYVIDPAIFDDKPPDDEYKSLGLKYYPDDGVVAEDNDTLVDLDRLDMMTGREALTHFGEFEDDRVCVRNENWKVDYEICIQGRSYKEVLKEKPWLKK